MDRLDFISNHECNTCRPFGDLSLLPILHDAHSDLKFRHKFDGGFKVYLHSEKAKVKATSLSDGFFGNSKLYSYSGVATIIKSLLRSLTLNGP